MRGSRIDNRVLTAVIWVSFFVSGACGLLYEVTWTRMLTLVFGASVFAMSAVLTAFMGGLALGSFVLGKLVDRSRNPLRVYGLFELGIGAYAYALTFVLRRFDLLYIDLIRDAEPSFYVLSLIRFALAVAVLIVPTALMGGTLPVLSKFVGSRVRNLGWSTGSLYAVNTLGAVVGCSAAGFLLIRALGIQSTIRLAVIGNVLVGATALLLSRSTGESGDGSPSSLPTPAAASVTGETPQYSPALVKLVLVFFGISGFCSLAYEVLWTRALVFHLNISIYGFVTMLTTFLTGIAIGSFVFARVSDRSRDPLLLFCVLEVLIGVSAVLSLPVFGKFFYSLESIFPSFGLVMWLPSANKFVKSFMVMFLPTFMMGATFPLVVRICSQGLERLGRNVGTIYSSNTLGCILGSFASAFVLIPLLGIGKSILLLGCVNVAMGVVLFAANPLVAHRRKALVAVGTLPVLALFAVGVSRFADIQFSSMLEDVGRVLYYKEGIGATVKVFENKTTGISEISIDGYPVACSGNRLNMTGPEIQHALAHFPMLLHPNPKDVCIVGFGAGGTSYNVSRYDVDSIVCVELSPEVPKAARFLSEVNHGILNNPKFKLVVDDGRNFLLRTDRTFDVITVDATSPKFAGNVSLYTKEFYEMCRDRMNPGGVVALWTPYHLLSRWEDLLLFNTFRQSFEHYSVWFTSNRGYFLLIGSNEPIAVDFQHVADYMSRPGIREEMAWVGLDTPYHFLSCFVMGEGAPDSYFDGIPINTDDHPYIEYFTRQGAGLGEFIFDGRLTQPVVYNFGDTPEEAVENSRRYKQFMAATNRLISAQYWRSRGAIREALESARQALAIDPTNREAVVMCKILEKKYQEIHWAKAIDAQKNGNRNAAINSCYAILDLIPSDRKALTMLDELQRHTSLKGASFPSSAQKPYLKQ